MLSAIGNSRKENPFLKEVINCVGQTVRYFEFSIFYIYCVLSPSILCLEPPGVKEAEGGLAGLSGPGRPEDRSKRNLKDRHNGGRQNHSEKPT